MNELTHRRLAALLPWLVLLLFETGAQVLQKAGSGPLDSIAFGPAWVLSALTSQYILGAIGCYIGAFATWMLILRRTTLSFAFPLTARVFVTVLLASSAVLGESVDVRRWVGVVVIVCGVILLGPEE